MPSLSLPFPATRALLPLLAFVALLGCKSTTDTSNQEAQAAGAEPVTAPAPAPDPSPAPQPTPVAAPDDGPAQTPPAPAVTPEPAAPAAAAPATPLFYHDGARVFVVDPDAATPPRDTTLPAGQTCASTLGYGSGGPLRSPDGRWIAWLDPDLWLGEVATGERRRITQLQDDPTFADSFCLEISAWSPDSQVLLYHVGPALCEECPEPPPSLVQGFHWLAVDTFAIHPLPGVRDFRLWLPDGRSFLSVHTVQGDDLSEELRQLSQGRPVEELHRVDFPTGEATLLHRSLDAYAFGQIALLGADAVVFSHEGRAIHRAALDDLAHATPVISGAFAELQWPTPSPDGTTLALNREGALWVLPLAAPAEGRSLGPVTSNGLRWLDARRLAVERDDGVYVVDVDSGAAVQVAEGGALVW